MGVDKLKHIISALKTWEISPFIYSFLLSTSWKFYILLHINWFPPLLQVIFPCFAYVVTFWCWIMSILSFEGLDYLFLWIFVSTVLGCSFLLNFGVFLPWNWFSLYVCLFLVVCLSVFEYCYAFLCGCSLHYFIWFLSFSQCASK